MFDISSTIREIAILAVPLLAALTLHELAHGLVAYRLGDPTAKNAGRLTLNPLKHLDPIGTLVFFLIKIGWAKPVPVDARYFKNPRAGMALVSLAGPAANFIMAAVFAAGFHLVGSISITDPQGMGMKILIPVMLICQAGVLVNLILGLFNLIPIPPLDGSGIVQYFLPPRLAYEYERLGRYGIFFILGLFLLGNIIGFSVLGATLFPAVRFGAALLGVPI